MLGIVYHYWPASIHQRPPISPITTVMIYKQFINIKTISQDVFLDFFTWYFNSLSRKLGVVPQNLQSGEIEQLNVHKEYLIMLLEMSKTSGKTFAPCANVAAIVKLAKVVEDLVRKSKSQIWFWLQLVGEAASHLKTRISASVRKEKVVLERERPTWQLCTSASTTCRARFHQPCAPRWTPRGKTYRRHRFSLMTRWETSSRTSIKFSPGSTEQGSRTRPGRLLFFHSLPQSGWKWTCHSTPANIPT